MCEKKYHVFLKNITKSFKTSSFDNCQKKEILLNVSMAVRRGEFCTIIGPNGCGKTTLLRMLAGVINPDKGQILINGKSPLKSKVGFVFQNYSASLFPWRNVLKNIEFPLELIKKNEKSRIHQIHEFLKMFSIDLPLKSRVYELSSGQQQLICIVRALITEPQLLLLDEPFGSLDFETRAYMQEKLLQIWKNIGTTVLFVSHDIDESIYLGQRIFIFSKNPGHIIKEVKNSLGYPRSKEALKSKSFLEIRELILNIFEKKDYEHSKNKI
ncbi:MAG: ABC transporter ATP-binding protein [Promethearchaeota archaeon]